MTHMQSRPITPIQPAGSVYGVFVSKQKSDNDRNAASTGTGDPWSILIADVALKRDEAAFKCLYNHFAPRVKSFIMRGGMSTEIAEGVAQETLLTVWRKAKQFDSGKASASTWIYTIARNKKIDRLRKDLRPLPDHNDPVYMYNGESSPETDAANNQSAVRIREIIEGLPEDQKQVLILSFLEDEPHSVISDTLGIPLGTVKSRIRLAMERMRHALADTDSNLL